MHPCASPEMILERLRASMEVRKILDAFYTATGVELGIVPTVPPTLADLSLHLQNGIPCERASAEPGQKRHPCLELHTRVRARVVEYCRVKRAICQGGNLYGVAPILLEGSPIALLRFRGLPDRTGQTGGTRADSLVILMETVAAAISTIAARQNLTQQEAILPHRLFVAIEFAEKNYADSSLNVSRVARHAGVTPQRLAQLFRTSLDTTFTEWLVSYRVATAMRSLRGGKKSLLAIALECGFGAVPTFNRIFREQTGLTPDEYRRGDDPDGASS